MRTPEDPYLGMGWHVTPTPTIASYYIVCVCLLGGGGDLNPIPTIVLGNLMILIRTCPSIALYYIVKDSLFIFLEAHCKITT